jgi:V8-like Glu-specific endopeptidase
MAAASIAAVAALALALTGTPAGAVIDGTDDTANQYENVGALQLRIDDEWFTFCSGTLVRADVVLTAAHCTDFLIEEGEDGFGPDDLRISFDPEGDAPYYTVDHIVVHPDWLTAPPGRGNSKHLFLAPPAEDIALVFLDSAVAGVTPAPIADADYLAGLDLTSETFTVVGYGTDEYITGSAASPMAITVYDGARSYMDVSVITTQDLFPDRFVKITKSVCFGDSGGPHFWEDSLVLVSVTSWGDAICRSLDMSQRTDLGSVLDWLEDEFGVTPPA